MDTDLLTSIGISEKAAKIYLSALSLGTASVQDIALKTKLKRPTVYLHIDELIRQGLFEKVALNNKRYYRASEPKALETRLQKNLSALQSAMPDLTALQANTLGRPQVRTFEGAEGIKKIYEEMEKANSLRIWSDFGKTYALFSDAYAQLGEAINKNGIGAREIIADTKESRRYSRLWGGICGPTYSARIATSEGLANDNIIYGNIVAIFRLHEYNMFVVRIEDKTIADSMKALFDMAWKSARPFRSSSKS